MDLCINKVVGRTWCEMMQQSCSEDYDEVDTPIYFSRKFNEFGLKILDGGSSYYTINYCPFCAVKLPDSLRDRWFEEMDKLGIVPWKEEVPEKYKTDEWYRELENEKL
ncbi:MAG: DUF6980 family protein [Bacteroidota bacterium]|jgi:hypothetical protein